MIRTMFLPSSSPTHSIPSSSPTQLINSFCLTSLPRNFHIHTNNPKNQNRNWFMLLIFIFISNSKSIAQQLKIIINVKISKFTQNSITKERFKKPQIVTKWISYSHIFFFFLKEHIFFFWPQINDSNCRDSQNKSSSNLVYLFSFLNIVQFFFTISFFTKILWLEETLSMLHLHKFFLDTKCLYHFTKNIFRYTVILNVSKR